MKPKTKRTPNWKHMDAGMDTYTRIYDGKTLIANVIGKNMLAHADLIAAAPQLLQAVKIAYSYFQNVEEVGKAYGASMNNKTMEYLRAAITKAKVY